jgi:hypothetical protein
MAERERDRLQFVLGISNLSSLPLLRGSGVHEHRVALHPSVSQGSSDRRACGPFPPQKLIWNGCSVDPRSATLIDQLSKATTG